MCFDPCPYRTRHRCTPGQTEARDGHKLILLLKRSSTLNASVFHLCIELSICGTCRENQIARTANLRLNLDALFPHACELIGRTLFTEMMNLKTLKLSGECSDIVQELPGLPKLEMLLVSFPLFNGNRRPFQFESLERTFLNPRLGQVEVYNTTISSSESRYSPSLSDVMHQVDVQTLATIGVGLSRP